MALQNYSDIRNAIGTWLNRPDLTQFFSDFVRLAEARVYRELRIRAMETSLHDSIANGIVIVPEDYIELKFIYLNTNPVQILQRKPVEFIFDQYPVRSADGVPKFIARDAESFIFGPFPDSEYQVKGTYYKRLPSLSEQNENNWFTDNAPDILLYASLLEAEPFIKNDERLILWRAMYERAKDSLMSEEKNERVSGSTPRMTVSIR